VIKRERKRETEKKERDREMKTEIIGSALVGSGLAYNY